MLEKLNIAEELKERILASIRKFAQFGGITISVDKAEGKTVHCSVEQHKVLSKKLSSEELKERAKKVFSNTDVKVVVR